MSDGKKSAATTFQGRKSRRAVYTVAPDDFTHVGNGHYIHQMVLSKENLRSTMRRPCFTDVPRRTMR